MKDRLMKEKKKSAYGDEIEEIGNNFVLSVTLYKTAKRRHGTSISIVSRGAEGDDRGRQDMLKSVREDVKAVYG